MGTLDSQAIEIVGRSRLVEQLLLEGIEVALPARDRGIDLIAYVDIDEQLSSFVACPIQMKVATGRCFTIDKKYGKFPNLIHAFVWRVNQPAETEIYALTQAEAVAVGKKMGYTATRSWKDGKYTNTKVTGKLLALMEPHRIVRGSWKKKIWAAMSRRH